MTILTVAEMSDTFRQHDARVLETYTNQQVVVAVRLCIFQHI